MYNLQHLAHTIIDTAILNAPWVAFHTERNGYRGSLFRESTRLIAHLLPWYWHMEVLPSSLHYIQQGQAVVDS